MGLGASEAAAKLIASSPDQIKKFSYDGVDLRFNGSDLAIAEDPNARAHFVGGPFKALFAVAMEKNGDVDPQLDEALITSARAGNLTAKGQLLRALNGDAAALDKALADKGKCDDQLANGYDKDALDKSKNPFIGLRDPKSGKIVPEKMLKVESLIRAVGTAKSAAIAKSAGLRLDGSPIPEKFR
jgi:hypothetical protein